MTHRVSRLVFGLAVFCLIFLSACGETATSAPAPAAGGALASPSLAAPAASLSTQSDATAVSLTRAASSPATSVPTAAVTTGQVSAAPTNDPCKILTPAEIKTALGLPGTVTMRGESGKPEVCAYDYTAPSAKAPISLGILHLLLNRSADAFSAYAGDGAAVSGLGDTAAYSEPDHLLVVQKGSAILIIGFIVDAKTVSADIARAASHSLAATALTRIPASGLAAPTTPPTLAAADVLSCQVLAKADIEAVLGVKLADPIAQYGGCLYYQTGTTSQTGMPYLSIVARRDINRPEVDKAIKNLADSAKLQVVPVSGIGDSAVAVDTFLNAFKGNAYVSLQPGTNAVTLDQVKQLALKALPKL